MKKFLAVVMCIGVLFLTGCGAEKEKTLKCSRTLNQSGIKMDLSYNVNYKGDYVTKVKSVEKIISSDSATLEAYKEQLEKTTESVSKIEHYDHDVKIDGDTLTSTITIDYTKIDTDKLIETDSSLKQLIKKGKVSVKDIKTLYNGLGVTCED